MSADEIEQLLTNALAGFAGADSVESLKAAEIAHLGKSAPLTNASKSLGSMAPDERKSVGAALHAARQQLSQAHLERLTELKRVQRVAALQADRLDLTEGVNQSEIGRRHLISSTTSDLEDIFLGMGFTVFNQGPEAETDWENFEALNFPPSHPARTMHDTFWLNLGDDEQVLMRTHTSPMQIRVMKQLKPPIYAVMPGVVIVATAQTPAIFRFFIKSRRL